MLGKIVKYDMRAIGRILLPVYGAMLAAAFLFGLSVGPVEDEGGILQILTGILYGAIVVATIVVTVVLIVTRYYQSMMGDEGYLTHVLPVRTGTLIAGKTIASSLWVLFGSLTGMMSCVFLGLGAAVSLLISGKPDGIDMDILGLLHELHFQNVGLAIICVVELLVLMLTASAAGIGRIYTSISVGHLWSNHRIAGAVLVYIGIGLIVETVGTTLMLMSTNWMPEFMDGFFRYSDLTNFALGLLVLIVGSLIVTVIYSLVSWLVLKKHLNLQ